MVGRIPEEVLVLNVVLGGYHKVLSVSWSTFKGRTSRTSTNHPDGALRLGQETVATEERDLAIAIKIVISEPDPHSL